MGRWGGRRHRQPGWP